MSIILEDFRGPACLYRVLNDRFKRNPWYLRRNIRVKRRQKVSNEASSKIHFHLRIPPNNDILPKSIALIVLGGNRNDSDSRDSYQICDIHVESRASISMTGFDIHHEFAVNADLASRLNSLFLLAVANDNGTESSFRKHAELLAAKLLNTYTKVVDADSDIQLVKTVKNYSCLIDLIDNLRRVRNQWLKRSPRERRISRPDFVDMTYPTSSNSMKIKLSECTASYIKFFGTATENGYQFRSVVATLMVKAEHSAVTGSNPSRPSTSSRSGSIMKGVSSNHDAMIVSSIAFNRHRRAASIRQEDKTKEGIVHFHYYQKRPVHSVSALNPVDADTYHDEVSTFNCPLCPDCLCKEASANFVIDGKPTKSSRRAFLELVEHLKAWHHHFMYDFWYDYLGDAHIRIERSSLSAENQAREQHFTQPKKNHVQQQLLPPTMKQNRNGSYSKLVTHCSLKSFTFGRKFCNSPPLQIRVIAESGNAAAYKRKMRSGSSSVALIAKAASSQISGQDAYGRRNLTPFYHAATGQSVTIDEFHLYDSDDDNEIDSKLQATKQVIDEYMDISAQEKTMMHLWNTHISTFPPYGDRLFPLDCYRFVTRFADVITKKGLRHGALLHFLCLYDRGLLLAEEIPQYMAIIDTHACSTIAMSTSQQQK